MLLAQGHCFEDHCLAGCCVSSSTDLSLPFEAGALTKPDDIHLARLASQ